MDRIPKRVYRYATLDTPSGDWLPENDGIDHINLNDVDGKTPLGRQMARGATIGFEHPYLGRFRSVESFWFWVRFENPPETLRKQVGSQARRFAEDYAKSVPNVRRKYFRQLIMDANYYKILQNKTLRELLIESELPFTHYHYYKDANKSARVPIRDLNELWISTDLVELRGIFKNQEAREYVPISEQDFHLLEKA